MEHPIEIKLYLDTSIPSAFYDTSKPVRQLMTQKWFENEASFYDMFISVVTVKEIGNMKNNLKKQRVIELIF